MKEKALFCAYGLAHFWVDLSCAFLLFRRILNAPELALCLLLYNFCAFAMQMPLGLAADKLNRNGALAAAGCVLVAAAYALSAPIPMAVTAGLGNALFHLGGGLDVLNAGEKRAAALGVFVAPGALGLYFGTLWGKGGGPALGLGAAGLAVIAAVILLLSRYAMGSFHSKNAPLDPQAQPGYGALIPLFPVVVLRSYMGMNQAFPWKGEGSWGIFLTLALVLGKAAGGFIMDALGGRRAAALTLGAAAVLYCFSGLPLPGTLAVFLFNMTMPMTLWAAARVMPGAKGFTFGLLTFALFLGYLPSWLGWRSLLTVNAAYSAAAAVSLLLLWRPLGREVGRC